MLMRTRRFASSPQRVLASLRTTGAIVLAATVGYLAYLHASGNFHEVAPGKVYRAAQMDGQALVRWHREHGIASVLNLRGRIVTVVDMRARLGLPKPEDGKVPMAVGVDLRGESYGLLIDQIGEVLRLAEDGKEDNPVNLDPRMAKLAGGVHRLDGQLMVVLDVDRVLELKTEVQIAA